MPTADEGFIELKERLRFRSKISNRGDDPIYYLIFAPSEMIHVKSRLKKVWIRQLKEAEGWNPVILSLAEKVQSFFRDHKRRELWLEYERAHPGDVKAVTASLAEALTKDNQVGRWIEEKLQEASVLSHGMVIVTDIEVLHPFLRIGAVEQSLQGRCPVPLVILYPGKRSGSSSLKFLGVYPEDGNYRSIHIGG